jgi:hypothetical protein
MTYRTLAALLLLIPLATGCATGTGGLTPSASVTTAIQGWERWLSVDWTAQPRSGGSVIEGYVYNLQGTPMIGVQLLAQGLDATGNVVGQKVEWVQTGVPGLQRSYFRIAGMPTAAQYRVTVWSFETMESHSWM